MSAFLAAPLFTTALTGTVTVGNALTVAGFLASAATTLASGAQARSMEQFNSAVASRNAIIANQNAQIRAEQSDRELKIRQGLNVTRRLSSGLAIEGSPLIVAADEAGEADLERRLILRQGAIEALGFQSEAVAADFRGRSAVTSSRLRAGSTILTGAASLSTAPQKPQIEGTEVLGPLS